LHVGNVTREADDGGIGKGTETLHVGETGEGAVGCWCGALLAIGLTSRARRRMEMKRLTEVVSSNDDALVELDGND
jgi:hypothetical protein